MSHTVKRKCSMTNQSVLEKACQRIPGARVRGRGKAAFYDGQSRSGLLVELPGWKYPLVIDETTGELHYDNYNGHWGATSYLEDLSQGYTLELAKEVETAKGHRCEEIPLENGAIRLRVHIGGTTAGELAGSDPTAGGYDFG